MKRAFSAVREFFIHPTDIRISIFNIMATVGGSVSLLALIVSAFNGVGLSNLAALLSCFVFAFSLLGYSKHSGHYRTCYYLTIFMVFFIMFPVIFFTAGGIDSGMPIYLCLVFHIPFSC